MDAGKRSGVAAALVILNVASITSGFASNVVRMGNQQHLTRYGIVALAGIAVLGWLREPERHGIADSPEIRASIDDDAGYPRATFSPPAEVVDATAVDFGPEAASPHRARKGPISRPETAKNEPQRVSDTGRHESVDTPSQRTETRSRAPEPERTENSPVRPPSAGTPEAAAPSTLPAPHQEDVAGQKQPVRA